MTRAAQFVDSSIGKKMVMAATGLVLFGFVVGHLSGNLLVYSGAEQMDAYAHFLREHPVALWGTRSLLLVCVIAHIMVAIALTADRMRARPVPYTVAANIQSSYAARTMIVSGPILALFVVYHILHFTLGTVHPHFTDSVHANVVAGFRQWPASAVYIVAMLLLGHHLSHGLWSMFQTVGLNSPRWDTLLRRGADAVALLITLGNISIPAAVLAGILR